MERERREREKRRRRKRRISKEREKREEKKGHSKVTLNVLLVLEGVRDGRRKKRLKRNNFRKKEREVLRQRKRKDGFFFCGRLMDMLFYNFNGQQNYFGLKQIFKKISYRFQLRRHLYLQIHPTNLPKTIILHPILITLRFLLQPIPQS